MSDWLQRYNARKQGAPARPVAPPPPQPPPGYQQHYAPQPPPPPAYQPVMPQPIPGAPAHAPFGYDQATGVPVAPFGHDQWGRIITQPPPQAYPQQPQYVPQQPAYDPSGLPAPNGYGQPPYGQVHPVQEEPPQFSPGAQGFHERVQYAINHVQGNTAGNREVGACQQCGGPMVPTDASGMVVPDGMPQSAGIFNPELRMTVYPAGHCMTCGHINREGTAYAPGAGSAAMAGMVKASGPARMAPGGGSESQVAHQHGLPNLFAPK